MANGKPKQGRIRKPSRSGTNTLYRQNDSRGPKKTPKFNKPTPKKSGSINSASVTKTKSIGMGLSTKSKPNKAKPSF
jgi:hypothetical protein